MMDSYILDENKITHPATMEEYAEWYGAQGNNIIRVGYAESATKQVSTVFLGLDHNWNEGNRPLLFETMVFPNDSDSSEDELCERYSTWDEALAGHKEISERFGAVEMEHGCVKDAVTTWLSS